MRIVAGDFRGRKIKMPRGKDVRPTQDRVREAIFNVIREAIPESSVLDLYAGSGAFGIEALSRGASNIIFVDNNINCIRTIKSNLSLFKESAKNTQVLKREALRAIDSLVKKGASFDVIFMDPPYYKGLARNTLIKIGACAILSTRGFVICEHSLKDEMPDETGSIKLFKRTKYGDTAVSFYKIKK